MVKKNNNKKIIAISLALVLLLGIGIVLYSNPQIFFDNADTPVIVRAFENNQDLYNADSKIDGVINLNNFHQLTETLENVTFVKTQYLMFGTNTQLLVKIPNTWTYDLIYDNTVEYNSNDALQKDIYLNTVVYGEIFDTGMRVEDNKPLYSCPLEGGELPPEDGVCFYSGCYQTELDEVCFPDTITIGSEYISENNEIFYRVTLDTSNTAPDSWTNMYDEYYLQEFTYATEEDECQVNLDCGEITYTGNEWCENGNLLAEYNEPYCENANSPNQCIDMPNSQVIEWESPQCPQPIPCMEDLDCGYTGYVEQYCDESWNGDMYLSGEYVENTCDTNMGYCNDEVSYPVPQYEQCEFGCESGECLEHTDYYTFMFDNNCYDNIEMTDTEHFEATENADYGFYGDLIECEGYLLVEAYRYNGNTCSFIEITVNELTQNDYSTIEECGVNIHSSYYRYDENSCEGIELTQSQVTENDYETIEACGENIISSSSSSSSYISGYVVSYGEDLPNNLVKPNFFVSAWNWFMNLFN